MVAKSIPVGIEINSKLINISHPLDSQKRSFENIGGQSGARKGILRNAMHRKESNPSKQDIIIMICIE